MQFSHLTFYCFCVLATIYKWGILLKVAAKEKEPENCIVARVCILAGVGRASDCVERTFTSKNASDLGLRLSMETCVPGRQPWPDIGWFMERPVQRWIGRCWNRVQCRIGVETGSRQVWIGIVLRIRKDIHRTLVPQTCSVTVTSHTGQVSVFQGKDRDLGCWGEHVSGTLADPDTSRVLWTLPVRVHHNFQIYTNQRRQVKFRDRGKRDTGGKNVDFLGPASGNAYPRSKSAVKDILFSDFGDSSDVFTGELTPDEEIWNAGLPETLNPVMTFPDDYMARIFLAQSGKKKTKGTKNTDKPTAAAAGLKGKGLPPVKDSVLPHVGELPQFSPTNNLLPMKTVQEEVEEEAPPALPPQDLEGRDMMMALEENINNRLHSSLSSLLQDRQTQNKEELSLVAGLALENKVSDVLSSVEKEPNSVLSSDSKQPIFQGQGSKDSAEQGPVSVLSGVTQNEDQPRSQIQAGSKNEGGDTTTKVETPAESLPPPDQTISSVNKPRLPPKNARTQGHKKPSLNSTQTTSGVSPSSSTTTNAIPSSSSTVINSSPLNGTKYSTKPFVNADVNTSPLSMPIKVSANDSGGALMPQPSAGTEQGKGPPIPPVNKQRMRNNILKAEAYFQTSLNKLKHELNTVLHSYVRPLRKKLLDTIQPEIQHWGHSTAWTMVRQVCRDAMLKVSSGSSNWQNWLPWSQCTTTCGPQGYQIRHRDCQPELECLGSNYDLRPCYRQPPCQEAPTWLGWTEWGSCSVTCGSGVQFRARTCVAADPAQACEGSGTEFSNCTLSLCGSAQSQDAKNSSKPCPKQGHHPGKRPAHHHPHPHTKKKKKKKKKKNNKAVTTTPKPRKARPASTTARPRHRKRKRIAAQEGGLAAGRRARWMEQPSPDQLQGFRMLDNMLDELQGNEVTPERRKKEEGKMIPLQPLEREKLLHPPLEPHRPAAPQDLGMMSVSWSIWGLWSECSVSCDKGTEFRRRQCIKRKEDSLDGEPVKSVQCFGKAKDRRTCALLPCPVSVAISETLGQLSEGMEGHLTCRNQIKGQVHAMYWIAPSGEIINGKSDNGRYTLKENTLTIHKARQTDLGQYQCVLVGFGHSPTSHSSSNKTWSDTQSDKEDFGTCLENPCQNGGICEDERTGGHGQVAPFHFRCDCPEGFFGKRCEQKSLVHQYTPNLRIMGLVLVGMIALLFITCTCLCLYYWIESKRKGPVDMGPVMTRRRSEDQWRKMKSFDHKERSRKQTFGTRAMKRLSRIWTGKPSEEERTSSVRFGLDTSPDHGSSTGVQNNSPNDINELKNELTSGTGIADFSSENLSQNASPPTLQEFESESSPELAGGQKHGRESPYHYKPQTSCKGTQNGSAAFQNSPEFYGEFQFRQRSPDGFQNDRSCPTDQTDCVGCVSGGLRDGQSPPAEDSSNHVIIKLHNSQLYVDFQGDHSYMRKCPSKQEQVEEKAYGVSSQHSQRQPLQAPPRVIYSDDKMEMFSDSNGPHMQGLEDRLKQQRYSTFLGSSGESLVDPVTYIYRSQMSVDPKAVGAPSTSSSLSYRSKRKRHSKKWLRKISGVEHGFNQNNSDDSGDGNYQPSGEQEESEGSGTSASASDHSPSPSDLHHTSHSGHSSFSAERGHHSACHYSSTDSGQESETGQEGMGGRDAGGRLRTGSRSCQKVRDLRRETSTADTQAKDSQTPLPQHPVLSGLSHHRQVPSTAEGADTAKPAYMKYEVHHPDEPYPFRLARNTRKSRKGEDNTNTSSGRTEPSAQASSDNWTRRMQDSHSGPGSVPVSANVDHCQQRASATSSQQLCYLEGGGEGASAQVRTELRKSGRDMLLRRAMENSYIQATTSHEPWKSSFPNKKQSGFTEGEQNETSNAPTKLQWDQSEQSMVSFKPESSARHRLFSTLAPLSTTPSTSHGRRSEQQPFLTGVSQPSASVASSSRIVKHRSLPESSTAADFPPQFQSSPNSPKFAFGSPHQTHRADNSKVFNFAKPVEAGSESSGPFCQRSYISEADSEASGFSGCKLLFSNVNTARTPQATRKTLPDRTAVMDVMRSPTNSPNEGGNVCRPHLVSKTTKERNTQNQHLSNNWPSEPATSNDPTPSSTFQRRSSVSFEQRTKSDCSYRTQSKRVLKSALKQRCNPSKVILAEMKAQPARRVSFSEPYIHIPNSMDSMIEDSQEWQYRRSSDVGLKTHQGEATAADDKLSREDQPVNTKQRLSAITHIHRLSAALPGAGYEEQVPIPVCCEENLNRVCTSSYRWTGNVQLNTFQTGRQGLAQQFSDHRQERALGSRGNPAATSTSAAGPQSQRYKASGGEASQGLTLSRPVAENPNGPQPQQPHILVNIEPDSSAQSHLHALCDMSMDRGEKTAAPPPQSSQGLLTPLIPQTAVKKPQPAGQEVREPQSDSKGGQGEHSGEAEAAEPQQDESDPNLLGAMSFRSFQEMVAMRCPGAFFRPIDHTEKPPWPDK